MSLIGSFLASFLHDLHTSKILYIKVILAFALIGTPMWLYQIRYYVLEKVIPFSDLKNKLAVDGFDIDEWAATRDYDEVYLVDTVTNSIRQLTNDKFRDQDPQIVKSQDRVLFLSDRHPNGYRGPTRILSYSLSDNQLANFGSEIQDAVFEGSSIEDIQVNEPFLAIVEYRNKSTTLKVINLDSKAIEDLWFVAYPTRVLDVSSGTIQTIQKGKRTVIERK